MNVIDNLKHELACRQQIIEDMQRDNNRLREMVDRVNESCHRMRDEIVIVTAQTHAIVKAMMQRAGLDAVTLHLDELQHAQEFMLEKGDREGLEPGELAFKLRPLTPQELEAAQSQRNRVVKSTERVKDNSPAQAKGEQ